MRYAHPSGVDSEHLLGNLKTLDKWVCWRSVETDDGIRKKPTDIDGLEAGEIEDAFFKDSDNWMSYSEAVQNARKHDILDGIQVVIDVSTDNYIIIDFDDCVNPETGKVDPAVRDYLRMTDAYVELSPSGTGLHVILLGDISNQGWPDPEDAVDGEIYDKYIVTVTEDHVAGSSYLARKDESVLNEYFEAHNISWDELLY